MAYILSSDIGALDTAEDFQRFNKKWEDYHEYLESLRDRMPQAAFEFATAPWHYDNKDSRGLHDSWVNSLAIIEPAQGENSEVRSLEIELRLFGPYHDGITILKYYGVHSYSLDSSLPPNHPRATQIGHGDLLIDEIRLTEEGKVLHEIEFDRGSRWIIVCADIECTFHPNEKWRGSYNW